MGSEAVDGGAWVPVAYRPKARSSGSVPRRRRFAFRGPGRCIHVAAVCFRVKNDEIEFLLVRTGSGRRWTFPKGGVDGDCTYAAAAAREAYEEAGVQGRVEPSHFIRYRYPKRRITPKADKAEVIVAAHLCKVLRRAEPGEGYRTPAWFSVAKAKRRLGQHREMKVARELARVVDAAVNRIRRKHS